MRVATLALVAMGHLCVSCASPPAPEERPPSQSELIQAYWESLPIVEETPFGALRTDPDVDFTRYEHVLLEPVSWRVEPSRQDATATPDHERLLDEVWCVLRDMLGRKRSLVSRPAPGVLRVRVSFVEPGGVQGWSLAVSSPSPDVKSLSTSTWAPHLSDEIRDGLIVGEIRDARSGRLLLTLITRPRRESVDWGEFRLRVAAWVEWFTSPLDTS